MKYRQNKDKKNKDQRKLFNGKRRLLTISAINLTTMKLRLPGFNLNRQPG